MSDTLNHDDMPILDLDLSNTKRFEASRFLDGPETISAYLAEAMKANDPAILMKSLAEVAKARGVNQLAADAGVNRESLYKTLKGGDKTRFDTVQKLLYALGVELTVKPLSPRPEPSSGRLRGASSRDTSVSTKSPVRPVKKPMAKKPDSHANA
ncbi:putative addiction module antidote protein [Pseudomonas hunanensis]|uniref:Addiction module antidote protein n=1 Tax=Pseudomonas hunanensis TaxID=1247546 RepID=A0ACC6K1E5_9PSED|nr:putative addiction module antidote protein [Pseudomonas hunanensis]